LSFFAAAFENSAMNLDMTLAIETPPAAQVFLKASATWTGADIFTCLYI
jgi:hypothetical protein